MFYNSVDKIVQTYFAAVTKEPFTYGDKTYQPKPLYVSPDVFRGYTCPAHCGGCCPRFSLDYLPQEKRPPQAVMRPISLNGKNRSIWSDTQEDHDSKKCRNLDKEGRCGIHKVRPFSCDFELLRFTHWDDKAALSCRLFGRAWNMLRVDLVTRGALCTMLPPDPESIADTIRKLERLKAWTDHFELKTWLPDILAWAADSERRGDKLELGFTAAQRGFFS